MKCKKYKCSLTMEAAMVVPIFAFAILTIAFLIKVVYVHEIMQKAISETTNNVGQYMYLYKASGLKDAFGRVDESLDKGGALANDQIGKLTEAYSSIGKFEKSKSEIGDSISEGIDLNKLTASIDNIRSDFSGVETVVKDIVGNPKREAISVICLIGKIGYGKAGAYANDKLGVMVAHLSVRQLLADKGRSADDRLKSLHVVNGLNGVNYTGSKILEDGKVTVVISYEVKIPLPLNFLPKLKIKQRATSAAWIK